MRVVRYNALMLAPRSPLKPSSELVIAVVAAAVVVALMLLAPHGLLDKADRAAYAVCHRLPDHSFTIAGRQLPLCARCTGTYLGALAGLAVLALTGKGRAGRFPTRPYLILLGLFMLVWAVDGTNSFLALLGVPHPYAPSNRLRLLTGCLEGVALAAILLPALNVALWRAPADRRSIEGPWDLFWLILGVGAVFGVVATGADWLLYPLGLLSGLAVPLLLGALNAMFYLGMRRRDGTATRARQLVAPLLVGLALALGEIALIGLARDALTARFGLPF